MSTLRSVIVWVVVLILLALFSWGLVLYMQWPLWGTVAVFLGVLGTYFLIRFLVRLVQVYRSRSRMTQLTAADKGKAGKPLAPRALLTRKWSSAIATLRKSSLKRFGNRWHGGVVTSQRESARGHFADVTLLGFL